MFDTSDGLAVCLSCLRPRSDLTADWVRVATEGRDHTTFYCNDDFAFPGRKPVSSPSPCPHCHESSAVIAVAKSVFEGIARFVEKRG
ncbi:MAG: hypothetical protein IPG17_25065 [Sandaracinaceae bacterium]|jgi:hypothetical protein|nr:hypothetical protein [Sandaracinaceae bacterium]MBP7684155.1 hypothetical protein [Deltaproteobacteria bacterium]MBK6811989.1 hypothetical protein [Sandaracinaceae bacterium]MBK7150797.1 hypothetical protein [Sandaracinaceae bacterium]MBK7777751.1 hypothetical protein [Sandaracinaceae bacterium]